LHHVTSVHEQHVLGANGYPNVTDNRSDPSRARVAPSWFELALEIVGVKDGEADLCGGWGRCSQTEQQDNG
jgi:hypothetical protein